MCTWEQAGPALGNTKLKYETCFKLTLPHPYASLHKTCSLFSDPEASTSQIRLRGSLFEGVGVGVEWG